MLGQLSGNIIPTDFDLNQMHRQCKLVSVQKSVLINVREFPDLAQNGVGQFRFDHLRFGVCTGDFSVDWTERVEDGIRFMSLLVDDPVGFALAGVDTWKNRLLHFEDSRILNNKNEEVTS